ncbi:MAG: YhcH/YjgK/YiaL family protein [Candidatus Merdivicinus sp.]|jgi:biofilm protein TabA
MILDKIENIHHYYGISSLLDQALNMAASLNPLSPIGKNKISENLSCTISEVQTKPVSESYMESHQRFMDLHVILTGGEIAGFAAADDCEIKSTYNETNDTTLYTNRNASYMKVPAGWFYIVFPNEAHMPACMDQARTIKKAILKVAWEAQ